MGNSDDVITEARLVDPEARLQHALDLSYRYLGFRDRSVAEVRRHLESKRVEPDTIGETVAELERQEYLDDARFARRFAEDRRTLDSWGADRIERRLIAAGVDPDLVSEAVAGRHDGASEVDVAVGVLRRRFAVPPATDRERERALGVLVRKGYPLDLSYAAVRVFEREPAA
jgi:regulatory protein